MAKESKWKSVLRVLACGYEFKDHVFKKEYKM